MDCCAPLCVCRRNCPDPLGFCSRDCRPQGSWRRVPRRARNPRPYGNPYGAMLAMLIPTFLAWWQRTTALVFAPAPIPTWTGIALTAMGVGVLISGFRDLYAALELPGGAWPWKPTGSSAR